MTFSIFYKVNCPYCIKTENLFSSLNINYNKFVLDKDFNRDDFNFTFGNDATFPRVLYNSDLIGGSEETEEYLKNNHR